MARLPHVFIQKGEHVGLPDFHPEIKEFMPIVNGLQDGLTNHGSPLGLANSFVGSTRRLEPTSSDGSIFLKFFSDPQRLGGEAHPETGPAYVHN